MTIVMPAREPDRTRAERATPGGALAAGSGDGSGLSIWTDQSSNRCVMRLRGRLTATTVAPLHAHVDLLGCRSCDEVVFDLSDLEELDEVGARVVVGIEHYVAARGGVLRIDGAPAAASAALERARAELSG